MKDNCSHLLNKSVMQIVAMLLVFLMLTGCSTNSMSNTITTELKEDGKTALIPIIDEDQAEERSKEAQKYTYEVHASDLKADSIDLSQLGISTPEGIVVDEEKIVISDSGNNCLYVMDLQGENMSKVGGIGNGECEFLHPTGLAYTRGYYYVVDSGNDRIEILDKDFGYVDQLHLQDVKFSPDDHFTSIAIDENGGIYVCGTFAKNSGIYYKSQEEQEFRRIGIGFYGSLFEDNGTVYAMNQGNIFINEKEETFGMCGGDNSLWRIDGADLEEICTLPVGRAPESFVVSGDKVTFLSSYEMGIMTFGIASGNYLSTPYMYTDGKDVPYESYMTMSNNTIYITNRNENNILILSGE